MINQWTSYSVWKMDVKIDSSTRDALENKWINKYSWRNKEIDWEGRIDVISVYLISIDFIKYNLDL